MIEWRARKKILPINSINPYKMASSDFKEQTFNFDPFWPPQSCTPESDIINNNDGTACSECLLAI